MSEVPITKGGRGPVGSRVKALAGKYIHARKKEPPKGDKVYWRTITRNREKIRQYWAGRKWIDQSVLTPTKGKK